MGAGCLSSCRVDGPRGSTKPRETYRCGVMFRLAKAFCCLNRRPFLNVIELVLSSQRGWSWATSCISSFLSFVSSSFVYWWQLCSTPHTPHPPPTFSHDNEECPKRSVTFGHARLQSHFMNDSFQYLNRNNLLKKKKKLPSPNGFVAVSYFKHINIKANPKRMIRMLHDVLSNTGTQSYACIAQPVGRDGSTRRCLLLRQGVWVYKDVCSL